MFDALVIVASLAAIAAYMIVISLNVGDTFYQPHQSIIIMYQRKSRKWLMLSPTFVFLLRGVFDTHVGLNFIPAVWSANLHAGQNQMFVSAIAANVDKFCDGEMVLLFRQMVNCCVLSFSIVFRF